MYINVCKRVNTRLIGGDVGKFQNPQPGTVIDAAITDRDAYEFYLVSTAAKQGLASPTRYTVIHDGIGESPHMIEHLTYKLCFTYYNVSGSKVNFYNVINQLLQRHIRLVHNFVPTTFNFF